MAPCQTPMVCVPWSVIGFGQPPRTHLPSQPVARIAMLASARTRVTARRRCPAGTAATLTQRAGAARSEVPLPDRRVRSADRRQMRRDLGGRVRAVRRPDPVEVGGRIDGVLL